MATLLTQDTSLTAVANAIRTKGGTSDQLTYPTGFVDAIGQIETGYRIPEYVLPADCAWKGVVEISGVYDNKPPNDLWLYMLQTKEFWNNVVSRRNAPNMARLFQDVDTTKMPTTMDMSGFDFTSCTLGSQSSAGSANNRCFITGPTTITMDNAKFTAPDGAFNGSSVVTLSAKNCTVAATAGSLRGFCAWATNMTSADLTGTHREGTSSVDCSWMFCGCSSLTSVVLPSAKANSIAGMFKGCSSLTSIDFTPFTGFSTISGAQDLFTGCTSLQSINLAGMSSATFQSNPSRAPSFSGLTNLKELIIAGTKVLLINNNAFDNGCGLTSSDASIWVPDDLVDSYKEAAVWYQVANQIKPISLKPV